MDKLDREPLLFLIKGGEEEGATVLVCERFADRWNADAAG